MGEESTFKGLVRKAFSPLREELFDKIGRRTELDCAIFWDFAVLFQSPRTAREEELFKEGLRASTVAGKPRRAQKTADETA